MLVWLSWQIYMNVLKTDELFVIRMTVSFHFAIALVSSHLLALSSALWIYCKHLKCC